MSERAQSGMSHAMAWSGPAPRRAIALGMLTIAVLASVAYLPAMRGNFLWDDDWLLLNNAVVHAPDGVWRMWFTTDPNYYWPVTNTVFWLEWRLFGTDTVGYHIVNLVLHISAALLVWLLLYRLKIPGGFLAALLWAVHPVSVEGVAWISQLKTVLSTVFLLLSMLAYLKADDQMSESRGREFGGGRWYWLSMFLFLLGMLSKASIAPLPLMLLLVIWWRHGSITRWDLVRMIPYFVVAAVLVPVNMWFETHGKDEVFRSASFLERLAGATTVPWFYLGKALVPVNLMFIYPMWSIDIGNIVWWVPLVASIAVTAVLVWRRETWWGRPLLLAWAFFWIGLIPVLGFTDVSLMQYTLVSDHYQYVSLVAVMALVAAGWTTWRRSTPNAMRWAPLAVAAVAVAALAMLTWQESGTYRDARTLLQATVDRNPDCWVAQCGLGMELSNANLIEDSLARFQLAIRINPKYAVAYDHCARALVLLGRAEESVPVFEEALRLDPKLAVAHSNFGTALTKLDRRDEAMAHFVAAVTIDPKLGAARYNLGVALYNAGQLERAAKEFEEAIRLDPEHLKALGDLGATLLRLGRPGEAKEYLQRALQLKPDEFLVRLNLGHALLNSNRPAEAIEQYEQCLKTDPNSTTAWAKIAIAKSRLARADEAIHAGQRALFLARSAGRTEVADQIELWLKTTYGAAPSSANALSYPELPPGP